LNDPQCSPPIFIVGVPRSGTTLLSAMLGAHPRLVCGPETHFFEQLGRCDARALRRRASWPKAAIDYLYAIEHMGESIPANYGLTRPELAEALARREPSLASALSGMIDLYTERNGKRRWVEKTPDHLPHVALIRRHYPDAPIVRIIRDPRDVATSLLRVSWGPPSLLSALTLWRDFDDRSARFFEVDSRCHTLRYEDLVRDPEPVLRDLCRAVDEPFDPAMLDTTESSRLVNAANEAWKAKVAERVDASRVEAWRAILADDELRLVEAWLGDRLRAYGYPASHAEPPHYVEVHRAALLGHYPEVAADLAARGARFWGLAGERPELSLFLGDPNHWLGTTRRVRYARTAGLARTILRHRLAGVPMAWFHAPGRAAAPGFCAGTLSRLLPRPIDASAARLPEQILR
jgi:hypothetical protein